MRGSKLVSFPTLSSRPSAHPNQMGAEEHPRVFLCSRNLKDYLSGFFRCREDNVYLNRPGQPGCHWVIVPNVLPATGSPGDPAWWLPDSGQWAGCLSQDSYAGSEICMALA